nr:MAG TPA: hypothetical protein [Caudoviricetes sp.]
MFYLIKTFRRRNAGILWITNCIMTISSVMLYTIYPIQLFN